MSWKGVVLGGWIGHMLLGPLGALLGACLGSAVEREFTGKGKTSGGAAGRRSLGSRDRAMIFCASAAAMLAKLAKADGVVTPSEIASVENAFSQLGFDATTRAFAISVFRKAKDDSHTIYEYAEEFARAVESSEVREELYSLLWDLACADGVISPHERQILRAMPRFLGISPAWYGWQASRRRAGGDSSSSGSGGGSAFGSHRNELADAYITLGVSANATDEEVRKAYREKAKQNHPDTLRAKGLPDEMIGRATERMKAVNAAWATIRTARGIK